VPIDEVYKAAILAARTLIEKDPGYTAPPPACCCTRSARKSRREVLQAEMHTRYADYFPASSRRACKAELLDEKLLQYDLAKLGAALKADRDLQFDYLGLQTLYDRYFLHIEVRIELPQAFFMRVAMGLALNEIDREAAPSSSTKCCRASTSCELDPRCSTPARAARSCRAAT
jgi:ribonucleoside-diphosphate reductase alpha chain